VDLAFIRAFRLHRMNVARWLTASAACLFLILPLPLRAQEKAPGEGQDPPLSPRGVSVGVGLWRLNQTDELVSPVRYGGYSWRAFLGLGFSTSRSLRDLRLSYSATDLTSFLTEGGRHLEKGHWVDFRATALRRVKAFHQGALSLSLGGALSGRFALLEHWYTEENSDNWSDFFALVEPGAGWHLRLPGGGVLSQEVMFPLAGVAVRSPYQGFTEVPRPRWVGPGGVKGIFQTLHYRRPFRHGWWGGFTYSFQGFRYGEPRPLAWTRHVLSLQVILPWARP
jgi:hypothetical protein